MAIKPNKKGVVTGTKNADKITRVSGKSWEKALTVNARAGNDVINFKKRKHKNKIFTQKGAFMRTFFSSCRIAARKFNLEEVFSFQLLNICF